MLIDRGAAINPREGATWHATPIGFAAYADHMRDGAGSSAQHTRDVWTLALRGLPGAPARDPERRARSGREGDGQRWNDRPLWWLPDDEGHGPSEIADLLLSQGAEPVRHGQKRAGRRAADWALAPRRGAGVARRLGGGTAESAAPPPGGDLARYESLARDLLFAFETGRADSMARLMAFFGGEVTWEDLRTIVRKRLEQLGDARPEGYFALPHARKLIADQAGFGDWAALEAALSGAPGASPARTIVMPPPEPAGVPVEMRTPLPMRLRDGTVVPTTTVWQMLTAARTGDLAAVETLVGEYPSLVLCDYNYMPPLHLAVREGHVEVVRFLAERGAVNPNHKTYPYNETIRLVAEDRGLTAIVEILDEYGRRADPARSDDENGDIDYGKDAGTASIPAARQRQRPGRGRGAAWRSGPSWPSIRSPSGAKGVLMMPAHDNHWPMIELLMRYGARVPEMTKWCREYYFKHYDTAAFLIDRGMNPNHMNCDRTTLLHGMAQLGDVRRATLLLDHGAVIDAVDDEFRSTPLGLAARWGHLKMVRFLLDRGADRDAAGAEWATPRAWARKKGHTKIEALFG